MLTARVRTVALVVALTMVTDQVPVQIIRYEPRKPDVSVAAEVPRPPLPAGQVTAPERPAVVKASAPVDPPAGSSRRKALDRIRAADRGRRAAPRHVGTPVSERQRADRRRLAEAEADGRVRDRPEPLPGPVPPVRAWRDLPRDSSAAEPVHPALGTARQPAPVTSGRSAAEALPAHGASYAPASSWSVAPSYDTLGLIRVRVTNTSSVTWPAGGVAVGYHLYRSDQSVYNFNGLGSTVTAAVPPNYYIDVDVVVEWLPAGGFTVVFDMRDLTVGGAPFFTQYGVPASRAFTFTIAHHAPSGRADSPADGASVDTLTPSLVVVVGADGTKPTVLEYELCADARGDTCIVQQYPVRVAPFTASVAWPLPRTAGVRWNETYYWRFRVTDSSFPATPWSPRSSFTPIVPNPSDAAFFGANAGAVDAAGVNLFLGNYVRQETDLAFPAAEATAPLALTRTYNSAATATGMFGVGWFTVLDSSARSLTSGFMTVTMPDGRQMTFGRNGDGSWGGAYGDGDAILLRTVDGVQVLTAAGGTEYVFGGSNGAISAIRAPDSDTVEFAETGGRITSMRSARTGRGLYFTWTGGQVATVSAGPVSGAAARTWTYAYTGATLATVCDAESVRNCTSYTYGATYAGHPTPRLTLVQRPNPGNTTAIVYDGARVSLVGPPPDRSGAYRNAWRYSVRPPVTEGRDRVVQVLDPTGVDVYYEFGNRGELWQRWLAGPVPVEGRTRQWVYNVSGRVEAMFDENFNITEYDWNPLTGQLAATRRWRDNSQFVYTGYHYQADLEASPDPRWARNLVEVVDSQLVKTRVLKYWNGLVTSSTTAPTDAAPNGATTTYTYTCQLAVAPPVVNDPTAPAGSRQPCGRLFSVVDPAGRRTLYGYNRAGDRTQVTLPTGAVVNTNYDTFGDARSQTVVPTTGPSSTTSFTYDSHGRVKSQTDPGITDPVTGQPHQRQVANDYDGDGNLAGQSQIDLTDPEQSPADATRTTRFTYDDRDRQTSVTRDGATVSQTEYDAMGHVTRTVDAQGADYRYRYDSLGRLQSVSIVNQVDRPGAAARTVMLAQYGYDGAGRITSYTNAMGRAVTYSYTRDDLLSDQKFYAYLDPATGVRCDIVLHHYEYDLTGNRISDVSGSGGNARTTTYAYDKADQLTRKVLDPGGINRVMSYTYDPAGLPMTSTLSGDGLTEVKTNRYDSGGQLIKTAVKESPDLVTQYTHDGLGRLLSVTDPRGVKSLPGNEPPDPAYTTNYTYDTAGRLSTVMQPPTQVEDGTGSAPVTTRPTTTIGYDTFGDAVAMRDARGNTTTMSYDGRGRLRNRSKPAYRQPDGATVPSMERWDYDNADNVTAYTPPDAPATTAAYDTRGRTYRVTAPPAAAGGAPGLTDYTYDDNGNRLSVTDPAGGQATATYDEMDRPLVTQRGQNTASSEVDVRTHRYDDFGDPTAEIFYDARIDRTYNKAGEVLTETATGIGTTRYERDLAGRTTMVTDPMGRRVDASYDTAGRLWEVRRLDTSGVFDETNYVLDKVGNRTRVEDSRGHFWSARYDAGNRRLTAQDPPTTAADGSVTPGATTTFGYDAAGNLTRQTDANQQSTYHTYNSWNLPETTVEPSTPAHPQPADRTWSTAYDSRANPGRSVEPGGIVVTGSFDDRNRLTSLTGTGGDASASKSFDYDQMDRITSVSTPGSRQIFTYDTLGQLLNSYGPMGVSSFTYDELGRALTETSSAAELNAPRSTVTHTYSGLNLRTTADSQTGTVRTYDRNLAGQVTTETHRSTAGAAGPTRTYTYDDIGRPKTDTTRNPAGAVTASLSYTWDASDNLTSQTTGGQLQQPTTTGYHYDEANRLIRQDDAAAGTGADYTWDPVGNRTRTTTWTGTDHRPTGTTTATYDARNRILTSAGGSTDTTFGWTPRGTLALTTTTDSGNDAAVRRASRFDAFDRLIGVGDRAYTYDGLDRLFSAGLTASFSYSGLAREPASDGQFSYARAADRQLLSARPTATGSTAANLLTNLHGDVLAQTQPSTATVTGSRSYDPFGATTGNTGTFPSVGFQGSWTDADTGKVSAQARWYDPTLGRFTSRDSWSVPTTGAADTNHYAYGNANPTSTVDPNGHLGVPVFPAIGTLLDVFAGEAMGAGAVGGGAAAVGGGAACALVCGVIVAVVVVVAVAAVVSYAVSTPSTVGTPGVQPAPAPRIAPAPRTVRPQPDPPEPVRPNPAPPRTWTAPGPTTTWHTVDRWYDDSYLYTRTNTYSYTTNYEYTYYDGATWLSGNWNTPTRHTWITKARPLIDLTNPVTLPTPRERQPHAGNKAPPANSDAPCGQGGSPDTCTRATGDLPPEALTDAGGGGNKPPVVPKSAGCMPLPEDDPNYSLDECGYVDLYHGTSSVSAASIRANGVDPAYGPRPMDFGNGFYTTRDLAQATQWATRRFGNDSVVLHFRIAARQFSSLNSRTFSGDSGDFANFVRTFRSGAGTEVPSYDVVEGPTLRNPGPFMRGAAPVWGGNQVVFFGRTGPLLDAALQ